MATEMWDGHGGAEAVSVDARTESLTFSEVHSNTLQSIFLIPNYN